MTRANASIPAVTQLHIPTNIHVSAVVDSFLRSRRSRRSGRRRGMSSPEASRLKMCKNDTSTGAVFASSSAIRLSVRSSRSFRLRGHLLR